MPAFEASEYRARSARVRKVMAERNVDALLAMKESSMNYLTGYDGYSEYVPQLALVLQSEEDPILILRELDTQCAIPTSYLDPSRILSYPESYIGTDKHTPWEPIAAMIRERTKSSRIGCELTAVTYGIKAHAALTKALGVEEFVDFDGVVAKTGLIKSEAEIAYMEQAGKIGDRALKAGMQQIAVGARECDVAAAVMHALCAGTPEFPGSPSRFVTMPVASGGRMATAPHIKWTDGRYQWNSQTNFEILAVRHRYFCPISRTVYLGDPPDRLKYLHEAAVAGFLAALEIMKPGVTCSDVDAAFRRAFSPYKIRKESRIGYAIGYLGEMAASIREGDTTVLQPNMTFHLLAGIWEQEDGYIFSESVRITEAGAKSFSGMPRDLLVNGR